ncbi:MAG: PilZ domain-containing protein [Solidesulfovibrio magneticus str. Maddingley MBC34]|uniref:PilZ domain-containing protein n=1 Tax=Solidesulfovibrio magneticus str. Maddingley MBC34 TaxID=1206767 RepID=K6GMV4_9BACT|nr:MAG: PilZ domain-containing protein [Solidesulfovibrio magneticus str. Maddingley MBC34]
MGNEQYRPMTSPAAPRRLLEEAMAQRSRCHLTLPENVVGLKNLDCAILESSTRGVLLESVGKAAAGPHWVGLDVKGYFRLVIKRQTLDEIYYTFDSRIKAAAASPAGLARLRLVEPERLVFGQRRKSLRLEPDVARLREAFFWRYDKSAGFSLDYPALRSADFRNGRARLVNLSAGGLGLGVSAALAGPRGIEAAKGDRLVVRLELDEPRATTAGDFWMVAKVCHVAASGGGGDLQFGLQFLASGNLDPKVGKIRWQPVEGNVIPELADILYYWHLDRHRERQG